MQLRIPRASLPLLTAGAMALGPVSPAPAHGAQASPPTAPAPALDPGVLERLKAMSELLKGAKSFTFAARTFREQRAEGGQLIDFYSQSRITVARPDRLRVDTEGDLHDASLWDDGKKVSIHARKSAFYAQTDAPPTLDETLTMLIERFQAPVPFAAFLLGDPYARMIDGVQSAFEVGVVQVDGVACRHLALGEDDADWQIWIEEGPRPLPRRLAVTYKKLEGAPRVVTGLSDWDLALTLPPGQFVFQAPAGARQIEWEAVPK